MRRAAAGHGGGSYTGGAIWERVDPPRPVLGGKYLEVLHVVVPDVTKDQSLPLCQREPDDLTSARPSNIRRLNAVRTSPAAVATELANGETYAEVLDELLALVVETVLKQLKQLRRENRPITQAQVESMRPTAEALEDETGRSRSHLSSRLNDRALPRSSRGFRRAMDIVWPRALAGELAWPAVLDQLPGGAARAMSEPPTA
ncbi:MAG TPA: hypothetical protein VGK33_04830 [Chloroflexota bacterium]